MFQRFIGFVQSLFGCKNEIEYWSGSFPAEEGCRGSIYLMCFAMGGSLGELRPAMIVYLPENYVYQFRRKNGRRRRCLIYGEDNLQLLLTHLRKQVESQGRVTDPEPPWASLR